MERKYWIEGKLRLTSHPSVKEKLIERKGMIKPLSSITESRLSLLVYFSLIQGNNDSPKKNDFLFAPLLAFK